MSGLLVNASQLLNSASQLQNFNANSSMFASKFNASQISQTDQTDQTNQTDATNASSSFGSIFQAYLDLFNQTNDLQTQSQNLQLDYAAGKTDDMLSVMLAQEKAYASLNFTTQVTSRIINAYQEIMRMQM